MATSYWLLKSEPTAYSWHDLLQEQRDHWDGVRNYQARNNLAAMKKGDKALFYHSVKAKEVVGVAKIVRESYPDPTTDDERWVVVDVAPVLGLKRPVKLAEIKADPMLQEIALVRQSRLSVVPLTKAEFDRVVQLGGRAKLPARC